jgi:hypothetical protein
MLVTYGKGILAVGVAGVLIVALVFVAGLRRSDQPTNEFLTKKLVLTADEDCAHEINGATVWEFTAALGNGTWRNADADNSYVYTASEYDELDQTEHTKSVLLVPAPSGCILATRIALNGTEQSSADGIQYMLAIIEKIDMAKNAYSVPARPAQPAADDASD